jgi:succinate dehydrogenase/fumarate reductase flavoprotein subunit
MGIVRDAALLARGLDGIARLRGRLPVHATLTRSRLLLAEHMLLAASRRRVSCGAHYRGDTGTARIQPRAVPASDCRVDS